ncbi:hypothetical protein GIB67_024998 [Kingdonia uniflora]|uniref:Uncharacterized protein n=1 Tax=Kingdonia uniflora TaxID=39325 RepID=A0A7J7N7Y4_9MAGN|nr:hypothetical protein GIB67_024998 [Kingdonia uniflora]
MAGIGSIFRAHTGNALGVLVRTLVSTLHVMLNATILSHLYVQLMIKVATKSLLSLILILPSRPSNTIWFPGN